MSTWYGGESSVYPVLIDSTSSMNWVYVRRNIEEHEREEEGETRVYYTFEEQKVPKEVWGIFEKEAENNEKIVETNVKVAEADLRIADVEEAITELYGIF
jgi:hypothetical protein